MPSVEQDAGRLLGGLDHLADGQDADLAVCPRRTRRARQPEPDLVGPTSRAAPFGVADGGRTVQARAAVSSMTGTSWADDGAKIVMPGILQAERHVEHAVVARAVVAGDPGPVEGEHDRQPVQADVEVGLVERPAEEGRVDGHHRPQAAHGHARRPR